MDVVRHAAIRQNPHARQELDPHQLVDKPLLLVVIKEKTPCAPPLRQGGMKIRSGNGKEMPPVAEANAECRQSPDASIIAILLDAVRKRLESGRLKTSIF